MLRYDHVVGSEGSTTGGLQALVPGTREVPAGQLDEQLVDPAAENKPAGHF